MKSLCKYSDLFGKPGTGLHKYKIANIAIVDVILTFFGAMIIKLIINKLLNINISYWLYLIALFIMGILLHRLFCVRTTIDKLLFK